MKILQLCKKFPFPLKDGESIAVTYLTQAMHAQGAEITLLAMNTSKHYLDIDTLPASFNHYKAIHTVEIDNHLKPWDAFTNLWSSDSYHISRYIDATFSKTLIQLLKQNNFDVVQLETLYLAPYTDLIREYSDAKIVMRSHNVEHEIWRRITRNTNNFFKKKYLNLLSDRLERFEIEKLKSYDALLAITERDLDIHRHLGFKNQGVVIPIGLNTKQYLAKAKPLNKKLTLCFIGSLDWQPNIEGVQWFMKHVWKELLLRFPKIELHIAGRNTPEWIYQYQSKHVVVHGEVPDAVDFINNHNIMIVPLMSGGGMRAKILEGMALGKVILTTSLGIEGIDATHKEAALIADTVEEFVNCVGFCYNQPEELVEIGNAAQNFVSYNYDNNKVGAKVLKFYAQLCGQISTQKHTFASNQNQ